MQLYDYQSAGVQWMLSREQQNDSAKGGILADEVGLGKTLMTLSLIKQNNMGCTLIIVPKSLVVQWQNEISTFAPELSVRFFTKDSEPHFDTVDIVIAAHSILNNCGFSQTILNHKWGRVVIDEAHIIKNKKSKSHKQACRLDTDIRWALTATPIMNKMTDFVSTLGWIGVPQDECQKYKNIVSSTFILRRTKEDTGLNNLSPYNMHLHKLEFSQSEAALYDSVVKLYSRRLQRMQEHGNANALYALELLLRVRQICCHPRSFIDSKKASKLISSLNIDRNLNGTKIDKILSQIREQPEGDKCLIFCHFIKEMDEYCNRLDDEGFKVVRIDGTMSVEERAQAVESFNKDPDVSVFVIQINTGGVGYNLQAANHIYITSPTWNPSLQHQVIGRAHRNGQTKQVQVHLYTIHSSTKCFVEDFILNLQNRKLNMIADILNDSRINTACLGDKSTILFSDIVSAFSE